MRLSHEEEAYLRAWMYDEVHYEQAVGPAKRLQVRQSVKPADLAILIAAAFPDPREQEAAGLAPPYGEAPVWPWSAEAFRKRLAEAHAILARSRLSDPLSGERTGPRA